MKIHIVKQGDTLYALSQKYGVPLQKIIEANTQISNPEVLVVGGKVKIPASPVPIPENGDVYYKHTVKQGDTLWKLSKAWGISLQEMIAANPQLKNPNALLVGEVVSIPKKDIAPGMMQSAQPMHMPNHMNEKAQPGSKTYTGPIEQPPMVVQLPEAPTPVVPAPVVPVEVAPVQEKMMHSETQSLYVQISVPTQEVVSYYEMPPVPENQPKHMVQPTQVNQPAPINLAPIYQPAPVNQPAPIYQTAPIAQSMPCYCDKSAGYPGLTENPNFYDCPPAYPLYEPMADMTMNAPLGQIQPVSYEPDCVHPSFYPNNMYSPVGFSDPWCPKVMPNYVEPLTQGIHENHPLNAMPPYGVQSLNMPWPTSCGCEMGGYTQPSHVSPYEMPMNNSFPMYSNPPAYAPYEMAMPQISPQYGMNASPQNMYGYPMAANIPPIPEYPGLGSENYGYHNRIPEFQQVDSIQENLQSIADSAIVTGIEETIERSEAVKTKSAPQVKTSSRATKSVKSDTTKAQRSSKNKGGSTPKKRRNPWISN